MPVMSILLLLIALVASIGALVGYIWLLIHAFRAGIWWGLGFLAALCVPFAFLIIIVFATKHWSEVKIPFLLYFGGGLVAAAVAMALPHTLAPELEESWGEMIAAEQGDAASDYPEAFPPASPTPPPTPAPTPTIYLPEALVDYTPVARPVMRRPTVGPEEKFVLTVTNAHERLGWTMEVTTTDGRHFEGILLAVDERTMTFERRLNTGSMIFPIPIADIHTLELTQ
jgi:hypothetical protein